MATSSSDESSTAPRDFHLSSSVDSGSRLSPNKQKCPLCSNEKALFFCRECIQSGCFATSNQRPESYGDKNLRLIKYRNGRRQFEEECQPFVDLKQNVDVLCSKIRQTKERNRVLKFAIAEKRTSLTENTCKLLQLREGNHKLTGYLPQYEERVHKLDNYIAAKQEEVSRAKSRLLRKQVFLKEIVLIRIEQLTKYIFPISKVLPKIDVDPFDSDMVSAIAEASGTTYVRNRWVYNLDNSGELQHVIVAPSLPGSGNYSAYNDWVTQNKDAVPSNSNIVSVESNPAYRISAALTYTAQLVQLLAFYLDTRLPYKLSYSDFCSSEMNEQQFNRRLARLNANILYLCFLQNTNLSNLHPTRTLHNVLQLLDTNKSQLGRQGPMEVDAQTACDLEQQLANDLQTNEDSDSEESDTVAYEWEAVPRVPEATAGVQIHQSTQQMMNTQQQQSVAGGLMNSAAAAITSFIKGWTGR